MATDLGRCRMAVRIEQSLAAGAHPADALRAGLPATSAWPGTVRVTTAPAPTIANGPTSQPATTIGPGADRAAVLEADRRDRPVVGPGQLARRR